MQTVKKISRRGLHKLKEFPEKMKIAIHRPGSDRLAIEGGTSANGSCNGSEDHQSISSEDLGATHKDLPPHSSPKKMRSEVKRYLSPIMEPEECTSTTQIIPDQCNMTRTSPPKAVPKPEAAVARRRAPAAAFQGFHVERFTNLLDDGLPFMTVHDWLLLLPNADPKCRFPEKSMHDAVSHLEERVYALMQDAAKVESIFGTMQGPLNQYIWALLSYSMELYEPKSRKSCPHQLYREVNTVCRMYAHTSTLRQDQQREWKMFLPFVQYLHAAIQALPCSRVVLYRGSGHDLQGYDYEVGTRGAWGGFLSASRDRHQAVAFVSKESELKADKGNFIVILSDAARCIRELSEFPEEEEHLHPLDLQLEVCGVLPASILQMLALRITILTFKRVGSELTLDLWRQALQGLSFIYHRFLASYVPSPVKEEPQSPAVFDLMPKVEEFISMDKGPPLLLIAAQAGMGKTSCALWLSQRVYEEGRLWLFISLPSVRDPFTEGALVRHLCATFGLEGNANALADLKQQPLVLILDSLDEIHRPDEAPSDSWWELNRFADWNAKLIVTCREENIRDYGRCLGDMPKVLYLQGFEEDEMLDYLSRRALVCGASEGPRGDVRQTVVVKATPVAAGVAAAASTVAMLLAAVQGGRLLTVLSNSKLYRAFKVPFKLSMAVDLLEAGVPMELIRQTALYDSWLHLKMDGVTASNVDDAMEQAEDLAWNLHVQGVTHDLVRNRGTKQWFRRCPLRVNNYHPSTTFSFQHKSLQEYLAAAHLWRKLKEGKNVRMALSSIDLTHDFAVLRFFGELCTSDADPQVIYDQLMTLVLASRDSHDATVQRCAANSISLLNASRVAFSGKDFQGIRIPRAILQCANLCGTNLRGALLKGADLKGAVMDYADLRDADLTGVAGELLTTFEGLASRVTSVAISHDGSFIVSGSEDCILHIWDRQTGISVRTMSGHEGGITSISLSFDSSLVASASHDKTVRVWNLKTGVMLKAMYGHTDSVNSVALCPDGKCVVSGSSDCTVRIWNWRSGELINTLEAHANPVSCVAVAPDNSFIVSGSHGKTVRMWDRVTGRLITTFEGHKYGVHSVAVAASSAFVVSGSADTTVRVWDRKAGSDGASSSRSPRSGPLYAPTMYPIEDIVCSSPRGRFSPRAGASQQGSLLSSLHGHTAGVKSVAISQDGTFIVSGSDDRTVRVWDRQSGWLLNTFEGHADTVCSVAISLDGSLVVSGSADNTIRVWDRHPGELLMSTDGHTTKVSSVAISSDGTFIVSGSGDNKVRIWDRRTGELLNLLEGHNGDVSCVDVSQDCSFIVSGSWDKTVRIWDRISGNIRKILEGHTNSVFSIAIAIDGACIVSGSHDKTTRLWDRLTGKILRVFQGPDSYFTSVALCRDSTLVACGLGDGTICIWNKISGELQRTLEGHKRGITSLALSFDGLLVVSGSVDETVRLWDTWSGEMLHVLQGHQDVVRSVAITMDGLFVVSGSMDHTVRVWERATGKPLRTLLGHGNYVTSVAISRDSTFIVSGSWDKTVRIWERWTGTMELCIREASERSDQLLAAGMKLSESTKLSPGFRNFLQQHGAKMV